jgi:hypothetical protein
MINEYSYVPEQQANLRPTVLKLPYEALLSQTRMMQDQYDFAQAGIIDNDNMLRVAARREDVARRNELVKAYEDELRQEVEKAGGDYGRLQPFVQQQAKRIKQDLNYGELGAIHKNAQIEAEAQKKYETSRSEGKINPFGFGLGNRSLRQFGATKQLEDGTYSVLNPYTPVKSLDIANTALSFADKIKDTDLRGMQISKALEGQYNMFTKTKGIEYNRAHLATAQHLMSNPEAIANIQEELIASGQEPTGQNIQAKALEYATAPALAVSHATTDTQIKSDYDYELAAKKKSEESSLPTYTPTANGAAFGNTSMQTLSEANDFQNYLKDQGLVTTVIHTPTSSFGTGDTKYQVGGKVMDANQYQSFIKEQEKAFKQSQTGLVDRQFANISRFEGSAQFANKSEFIKAQNKASKDAKNVTLRGDQLLPDQASLYQDLLDRNEANQLFTIPGEEQPMTKAEIADKYGVSLDKVVVKPNLIHYDSPDKNARGGALEVGISIKDGKNSGKVLAASTPLNDNFTAETEVLSDIGKNSLYQGIDTYTQENPKQVMLGGKPRLITTTTYPKKSYGKNEYPFNTIVTVYDLNEDGSTSAPSNVTYEQFKEALIGSARQKLKNVAGSGTQTFTQKDIKRVSDED